jgi:hypothetical protein
MHFRQKGEEGERKRETERERGEKQTRKKKKEARGELVRIQKFPSSSLFLSPAVIWLSAI